MKIIGIDPGTTTGIALCSVVGQRGTAGRFVVEATAEITGMAAVDEIYGDGASSDPKAWRWLEYYNALECLGWVDAHQPDLLVIEDFILQPGKGGVNGGGTYRGGARAGLSPARIGAALGALLEVGGYSGSGGGSGGGGSGATMQVVWQGSSMISRLNKARMDRLGLWVRGSEHKRDAVRHAYVGWQRFGDSGGGGSRRGSEGSGGTVTTAIGARKVRARKVAKRRT